MSSNGGIFESCIAVHSQSDIDGMLQCVSSQLESQQQNTSTSLNASLLVLSGALVFFMQAGFAMLCVGSVRRKNAQNAMLKNLLDVCGAAVAYFCFGYAFAFGGEGDLNADKTGTTFIGTTNFFGTGDISFPFYFFQYTLLAAAVTIVAGALAERCQMAAYLSYSLFLAAFVYPVVAHAGWSSTGFLSSSNTDPLFGIGLVDFSGSGVVHLTGGTTALFATYILGSRRGRFFDATTGTPLEVPKPFPGHSVSLQMLGSFILWFGWFGFNPGAALLLTDNPDQAQIGALCAVNTFLSSSAGCISALFVKMGIRHRSKGEATFDLTAAMNGSLSGLVAIAAGCATLEPWAAIVTGFIGGILYLLGSALLIYLRLDDAVDAIPVHLVNGMWGLIAVGLLSSPQKMEAVYGTGEHYGIFYSWSNGHSDANLLGCQMLGLLFIFGWTFAVMLPIFIALNALGWLRSESVQELVGLDIAYGGIDDNMGLLQAEGGDEGIKEEYLEAYEEYRQNMRAKREKDTNNNDSNQ